MEQGTKLKRAYKMRAYPTNSQESRARELLASHCEMYNAALEERKGAWEHPSRTHITYSSQSAQLKEIRALCPEDARWSFTAQQQTLRRLDRAFQAFFRRVKAGQVPGHPRFRSKARFDTVDHVNGDGARWTPTQGKWARCHFLGVGTLKVAEHTVVVGRVTQVSLKREGRRWYVIAIAEAEIEPLAETGHSVGIDMGIARFLVTSAAEIVDNPRFLGLAQAELARLQQALTRCERGSGNHKRCKRAIAKLHRKVVNRRRDFHHKVARDLVNANDAIAHEALIVTNMVRKPKPRPKDDSTFEPNGAAAKAGLNRVIHDAGWSQFIGILSGKAAWAGRRVIPVNPAFTSIDCARCGAKQSRPCQAVVICPNCGEADADYNASLNIYTRAGLGSGQVSAYA